MALAVKNPPAGDTRDTGLSPRVGKVPGRGHGNPPSILSWRTPWAEEPGGLQFTGPHRIGHDQTDPVEHI